MARREWAGKSFALAERKQALVKTAESDSGSTSTSTSATPASAAGGGVPGGVVGVPGSGLAERKKEAAAARARSDCALRRRWERETAIAEMKHLEGETSRQGVVPCCCH